MGGNTCPKCGEPADQTYSALGYDRLVAVGELDANVRSHRIDGRVYLHERGIWAGIARLIGGRKSRS